MAYRIESSIDVADDGIVPQVRQQEGDSEECCTSVAICARIEQICNEGPAPRTIQQCRNRAHNGLKSRIIRDDGTLR
jgi:hypothetical protein